MKKKCKKKIKIWKEIVPIWLNWKAVFLCFMVAGGSGSSDTAAIGHVTIDLIKETDGDTKFKLERLLEEPDSHAFFCLNCRSCIENIDVVRRKELNPIQHAFFSNFLIPQGILVSHSHPCLKVTLASAYLICMIMKNLSFYHIYKRLKLDICILLCLVFQTFKKKCQRHKIERKIRQEKIN